jgi:hypothetical protein
MRYACYAASCWQQRAATSRPDDLSHVSDRHAVAPQAVGWVALLLHVILQVFGHRVRGFVMLHGTV